MRVVSIGLLVSAVWCADGRADMLVVSGKVLDEAARPVAGADVWVRETETAKVAASRSDAGGSFRLQLEAKPRGGCEVLATAPGLTIGTTGYLASVTGPVAIRLAPEAPVLCRVLDQDDRPVAGAEVTLFTLRPADADPGKPWDTIFVANDEAARGQSDADGRLVLHHVPRGAEVGITVTAPGFARWRPWFDPGGKQPTGGMTEEYLIRLQPAATVEGALTHDGQPVPEVKVRTEGVYPTEGWDEAVSDANGRYRLEHLGAGTYNIMLDDLAALVAPAHEKVVAVAEQVLGGIDFALTEGGFIEGRIVDAETGEPITGTRAAGYGPSRPRSTGACFGTEVDEQGRYRLRVAPGLNYIYYQGGAQDYPHSPDASFEIEVAEGQTVQAPDIRVKRAEPVEVLVVDPEGTPVAGATVDPVAEFFMTSVTDEQGRCAIRNLPPDRPVVLVARDKARHLCAVATAPPDQRGEQVTVALSDAAAVELRFVAPDGQPLPGVGAGVWLKLPEEAGPFVASSAQVAEATSDQEGSVRLEDIPSGTALSFSVDRQTSNAIPWPQDLVLEPGQTHQAGDIVLDVRTMAVSGVVMLPDQTPVKGASVRAEQGEYATTRTDADGRFTLEGLLPSRPVTIVAGSSDGKLWGAEEVVPEWEYEPGIILRDLIRVTARLVDAEGRPLAKRKWMVSSKSSLHLSAPVRAEGITDEKGTIAFDGLMPGVAYYLHVPQPGPPADGFWVTREFVPEPDTQCDLGDVVVE